MSKKNNLHTLGYFKKRLLDAGYQVMVLISDFQNPDDVRKWMISIMGEQKYPLICICIKEDDNKYVFRVTNACYSYWSHKRINETIKTDSMNVILNTLKKYAI